MNQTDKIKIAFFDIDGTLVSFTTHRVPESALRALKALSDKEIEIVIVTGRSAKPIPEISHVPYSAIIGLNGSECALKDGTLLYRHSIPAELFERVLKLGQEYNFAVAAKFKEGFVVDQVTSRVLEMSDKIGSPCPAVRDLRMLFQNEGTGQMCIFTDAETEHNLMKYLPGLTSSRWCDIFADLNLKGIDKGSGVEHYLHLRGYTKDNAISFGDGGNDIAMLVNTGIGVAMGNANEELKSIADYITNVIDCDGIYNALRHFGLI